MADKCSFIKADGSKCKGWAISDGSGKCLAHSDSAHAADARAAGRFRNRTRKPTYSPLDIGNPNTADDCVKALSLIATEVMRGTCDPRAAQVASASLRAMLDAVRMAEQLEEARRQISNLRKRLGVSADE